jgi:hypothetical protein
LEATHLLEAEEEPAGERGQSGSTRVQISGDLPFFAVPIKARLLFGKEGLRIQRMCKHSKCCNSLRTWYWSEGE